jgi:hypothetical protein
MAEDTPEAAGKHHAVDPVQHCVSVENLYLL